MDMTTTYHLTFVGLFLIFATLTVQGIVASIAHRMQKKYIPGIVDAKLDHSSFVFRSYRAVMNSLETVPYMVAKVLIAILMGLNAETLGLMTLAYAIVRIVYTALFYIFATNKNPSPRSFVWMIGFFIQTALLIQIGLHLI